MTKQEVIDRLGLTPLLPEGGYVRELHSGEMIYGRPAYGSIYYLLDENNISRMHKLQHDELWFYHDGPPLQMYLIDDEHEEIKYLGKDLDKGEQPQICVKAGTYMGARMNYPGEYTLVSTTMTPAYSEDEFTLGSYEKLKERSNHPELLRILCE